MESPFVPADFDVPQSLEFEPFRLEPLDAHHNDRDFEAWMSSIDHIHATPGFPDGNWPTPMSKDDNLKDLVRHASDFGERKGFTYSILVGDDVVGCLYIYPSKDEHDADVSSWVTERYADSDVTVWNAISEWIDDVWPFANPYYAPRLTDTDE